MNETIYKYDNSLNPIFRAVLALVVLIILSVQLNAERLYLKNENFNKVNMDNNFICWNDKRTLKIERISKYEILVGDNSIYQLKIYSKLDYKSYLYDSELRFIVKDNWVRVLLTGFKKASGIMVCERNKAHEVMNFDTR